MKYWFRFILWIGVMFLSACSAATLPAATTAPTQPPASETPLPSNTPSPSLTLSPPPTATITPSPMATATSTSTSTPTPSFAGFSVSYAQYTNYGMLIGFHIPGLKVAYRLTVNDVDYTCQLNDKAPDSMACYGPQFPQNQTVKLVFLPPEGEKIALYEASYKVSLLVKPTIDPRILMTQAPGSCPQRGVNVTCETEYRNNGSGGYCIVSTCADACGYYYSVDTCPEGSINNGIYPMTLIPSLMPGNH